MKRLHNYWVGNVWACTKCKREVDAPAYPRYDEPEPGCCGQGMILCCVTEARAGEDYPRAWHEAIQQGPKP